MAFTAHTFVEFTILQWYYLDIKIVCVGSTLIRVDESMENQILSQISEKED
jgi:hypothetical protein